MKFTYLTIISVVGKGKRWLRSHLVLIMM